MLGSGRGYNEAGPQPIPTVDIIAYMDGFGIRNLDDRIEFLRLMRVLDGKYLQLAMEKISKDRDRLMKESRSGSKGR